MTADHPRRRRLTPAARAKNHATAITGLAQGMSKALTPTQRGGLAVLRAAGIFALVIHGDDPDLPRPACLFVYWIGAAEPANGASYDWWYTENVDA